MTIPNDLLDALMKDYKNPEDLIGETGLLIIFYIMAHSLREDMLMEQ